MKQIILTMFIVSASLLISIQSQAQSYPVDFSQVSVSANLDAPTAFTFTPDGNRIFITQQGGALKVIKNGTLLSTSAIELTVNSSGERGLLGIALDPNFNTNSYIYLYYTVPSPLHNRISRFTISGDVINPATEEIVLDLDALSSATNHNGGAMAFGPDGKLYIGVGENANGDNAQDLDNYLGKLLRINSDGTTPSGNPFETGSSAKKRIWAYGLRNPYTFEFQPGTGKLFVNDVGQSTWEEINNATTGGHNFGWPSAEGNSSNTNYKNPFFAYGHAEGEDGKGCAITGGTFFNPSSTNYPEKYNGKYFYMDLCEKWINYINPSSATSTRNAFATGIPGNSLGLKTGPDGNLYFLSRTAGALYKIVYGGVTSTIETDPTLATKVYPQPASDFIYVDINNNMKDYSVNFINATGKVLPAKFVKEGARLAVNTTDLAPGMYTLKISSANKIINQPVSIVRY